MTSIRERLAALRNAAREGAAVDAAEFVELETRAIAEEKIAALAAEGEAARAAEKAAREREARRATAATQVRDQIATTRAAIPDAHDKVVAALAELNAVVEQYNQAVTEGRATLDAAGFATWNHYVPEIPEPINIPDYDPAIAPYNGTSGAAGIRIDGTVHARIQPGTVALWATQKNPQIMADIREWKNNRDTYAMQPPMPELAN